ncbi:MAG: hypothetical protein IJ587_02950, partial [Synergistaceae bacterium]|nr:hypothetical protein [Synergistaceae bacterium]
VDNMPVPTIPEGSVNKYGDTNADLVGTTISHTVVDNNGNKIPEGTSIDVFLLYEIEFNEETKQNSSEHGYAQPSDEIDPMYPTGYRPSGYFVYDGFFYPTYVVSAVTDKDGRITLDVNNLVSPYDGATVAVPQGLYSLFYSEATEDEPEIVGFIEGIEFTSASQPQYDEPDKGKVPAKKSTDPTPAPAPEPVDPTPEGGVKVGDGTKGGCDAGVSIFGSLIVSAALLTLKKRK